MEKDMTVQELIDLLNQIEDKSLPIDIKMEGCYEEPDGQRNRLTGKIVRHLSDVKKRVGAYSLVINRCPKFDIDTDIVDGYVPFAEKDCEEILDKNCGDDAESREIVLDAINLRRKNIQRQINMRGED